MANEINETVSLAFQKSGTQKTFSIGKSSTMSGDDFCDLSQSIPTTAWTVISLGSITNPPAKIQIINRDATNYVELAVANDDSGIFAKLLAGDPAQFPPKTATMYAKANTGICKITVAAIE